jgi:hypothetical protein
VPTARRFADACCEVAGIDISPVMVEQTRKNVPEGTFLGIDVLDLNGFLGLFDAATAFYGAALARRQPVALLAGSPRARPCGCDPRQGR